MKKHLKGFVAGLIAGVLICTGTVAFATVGTKTIDVSYADIKIFIDGKLIDPKDATGKIVEPFIYDGTTYLPVRAVGSAFGKDVAWNGKDKEIYIGVNPYETKSWMDECAPYQYKNGTEYRYDPSSGSNKSFFLSGKEYFDGFVLKVVGNYYTSQFGANALFNLNGKYSSVSFTLGHVDNTYSLPVTLNIYLDDKLVQTLDIQPDSLAKTVTVPLDYALHMKLELVNPTMLDDTQYGFADFIFEA